jgi:hypothetical protein
MVTFAPRTILAVSAGWCSLACCRRAARRLHRRGQEDRPSEITMIPHGGRGLSGCPEYARPRHHKARATAGHHNGRLPAGARASPRSRGGASALVAAQDHARPRKTTFHLHDVLEFRARQSPSTTHGVLKCSSGGKITRRPRLRGSRSTRLAVESTPSRAGPRSEVTRCGQASARMRAASAT